MTESGQLRFPGCCGAVPEKSKTISSPAMVTAAWIGEVALWRLEHVLPLETPVGQTRDRRTDNAFRVVEELVHRRDDAVASASFAQLGQAPLRERVGGELGAKVAATFLGVAHPRDEVGEQFLVEPRRWDDDPSSASVREPAGMLPGSTPPTSAWCARVTAKPTVGRETSVTSVGACRPRTGR